MKLFFKHCALGLIVSVAFILIWIFFQNQELVWYPKPLNSHFETHSIDDSFWGGSSSAKITQTDSSILTSVLVRSGTAYPYAGLAIEPLSDAQKLSGHFFNFKKFDSLQIELNTKYMKEVQLRLITHDPQNTNLEKPFSARVLVFHTPTDKLFQKQNIAISDFKVPEWWFEFNNKKELDTLAYLNRGLKLEILSGYGTMLGIEDEIEIKKIIFFGKNHSLKRILIVMFLLTSAFNIFFYKKTKRIAKE